MILCHLGCWHMAFTRSFKQYSAVHIIAPMHVQSGTNDSSFPWQFSTIKSSQVWSVWPGLALHHCYSHGRLLVAHLPLQSPELQIDGSMLVWLHWPSGFNVRLEPEGCPSPFSFSLTQPDTTTISGNSRNGSCPCPQIPSMSPRLWLPTCLHRI